MRRILALSALITTACATPRSQADRAFDHHRYEEAAERYDTLAGESPDDKAVLARREESRRLALIEMAADVRSTRQAGREQQALRDLGDLLASRDAWQLVADTEVTAALAPEVAWARGFITREVDTFLRSRGAAAARAVVASRRARLQYPELATLWVAFDSTLTAADAVTCRGVDTPYLAALIANHCASVGLEVATAPLPIAVGGVTLEGEIEGMTAAQREELTAVLDRELARTAWYQRGAETRATVTVSGRQTIETRTSRQVREVPWYERVPYATTKYATGWSASAGTVHIKVPATEYREEERWFRYEADRREAQYRGDWRVAVTLGPRSQPRAVGVADQMHRMGYDHDVTYPDAGVTPTRADLPTADDWSQHLASKLAPIWRAELAKHWAASFCEETEYTVETAARCALGAMLPPEARSALAAVLGSNLDPVLAARSK